MAVRQPWQPCTKHNRAYCYDMQCKQEESNVGSVSITTDGELAIGIGGGLSIDTDGDLGIQVGGITIELD